MNLDLKSIECFVEAVNRRAEMEILKTYHIAGAHHRAMMAELTDLRKAVEATPAIPQERKPRECPCEQQITNRLGIQKIKCHLPENHDGQKHQGFDVDGRAITWWEMFCAPADELKASEVLPEPPAATCEWRETDPDNSLWSTSCGQEFAFTDGSPKENEMRFCCYCGKSLPASDAQPEKDGV